MIAMMRTLQTLVLILAVLFSTGKTGLADAIPGTGKPEYVGEFFLTPEELWHDMVVDTTQGYFFHYNKWQRIVGRIDKVFSNTSGDTVIVFYASCLGLLRVYCQVPREWADTAKHLEPGMEVDLVGAVKEVVSGHVFVVNCEIVKPAGIPEENNHGR